MEYRDVRNRRVGTVHWEGTLGRRRGRDEKYRKLDRATQDRENLETFQAVMKLKQPFFTTELDPIGHQLPIKSFGGIPIYRCIISVDIHK